MIGKRLIAGGSFLDLAEVDVSETWAVTQELKLDELIKSKTISRNSPEISAVWNQLQTLNRRETKRVGRALGCKASVKPT